MSRTQNTSYDLLVDQGATLHRVFSVKTSARSAIALTGYTARMQVREFDLKTRDSSSEIVAEYTTENGYMSVNASAGSVTLLVPPADTAEYVPKSYVYDIEIESSTGEATRIIQGKFIVRAEVTK